MSESVPAGWNEWSFSNVGKLIKGVTYSSKDYSDKNNGHPFLTIKCVSKDGGYSNRGLKFYSGGFKEEHILKEGDLVFANTDLTRNGDIVGSPFRMINLPFQKPPLFSMDLSKVVVDDLKVVSHFFYYWMMQPFVKNFMVNASAGSTVLHLNTKTVLKLKGAFPPLPEQNKIASILTSVDTVIEKTEAQINKLKDLKKAMMQELLTKGIGHTEFKDSPVGRIPVSWDVVELKKMAFVDKESLNNNTPADYTFKYIDIASVSNGVFIKPDTHTTFSNAPSRARRKVNLGDVLMSTVRPNLKAFTYFDAGDDDYIASTGFAVLTPKEDCNGKFILYSILSDIVSKQIDALVVGSNYPAINSSEVKSLILVKPSKEEQNHISAVLSSIDNKINSANITLHQTKSLKKALMQDLLTGKVRVAV